MNAKELREKSVEDLQAHVIELTQEAFALRMTKSAGELKETHKIKAVRREIARTKTLLTEKVTEKGVKS